MHVFIFNFRKKIDIRKYFFIRPTQTKLSKNNTEIYGPSNTYFFCSRAFVKNKKNI